MVAEAFLFHFRCVGLASSVLFLAFLRFLCLITRFCCTYSSSEFSLPEAESESARTFATSRCRSDGISFLP
ncbi:hypothetical protein B0H19DRAFT_1189258 [Mycena capillaripes]|nr:hypothetical protein B0H19DRAFT_1189258 [Mycena capillaripes]